MAAKDDIYAQNIKQSNIRLKISTSQIDIHEMHINLQLNLHQVNRNRIQLKKCGEELMKTHLKQLIDINVYFIFHPLSSNKTHFTNMKNSIKFLSNCIHDKMMAPLWNLSKNSEQYIQNFSFICIYDTYSKNHFMWA